MTATFARTRALTRPEVARVVAARHGLRLTHEGVRQIELSALEKLGRTLRRTMGERVVANRREINRAIEAAGELEAAAATLRRDGVALASRKGFSELAGDMEAALKSIRLVLDDAKVDRELRDRDPNGPDLGGVE